MLMTRITTSALIAAAGTALLLGRWLAVRHSPDVQPPRIRAAIAAMTRRPSMIPAA